MSRPAASFVRHAIRGIPRAAPAIPKLPTLLSRAGFATKAKRTRRFTGLPPEGVFEETAQKLEYKEGNPNVYYRCVEEWARAIKNNKTDDPNIIKRARVPLQTFHEAAIFLQLARVVVGDEKVPSPETMLTSEHPWTCPMLHYASDQGHDASTITLLNIELEHEAYGRRPANLSPVLRARLDEIMAANLCPDALVLGARIAERDGDGSLAASRAARAVELADGTGLDCEWLGQALVIQGRVQARAGQLARAREFFAEAISRRNLTRAWLELSYDGRCPEDVEREYRTAVLESRTESCMRISQTESEFGAMALERGDKARFRDHQFMAEEWLRVAKSKKKDVE